MPGGQRPACGGDPGDGAGAPQARPRTRPGVLDSDALRKSVAPHSETPGPYRSRWVVEQIFAGGWWCGGLPGLLAPRFICLDRILK